MSKLCIIPARGGSKRIPRKNIRPFLGKPIIAYSIETALESKLFDEVMVSTEDEEIAAVARSFGAKVPFYRSDSNADDNATTFDVLEEVLENYKIKEQKEFEYACCIYPTAPFVRSVGLTKAFNLLIASKYDSVFPVIRYGFPIQRALRRVNSSKIEFFNVEYKTTRSQDLEPAFHDAGQYYWFNVNACLNANSLITQNSGSIEIKETEGQDIDNEVDWKLAEIKYELL